MRPGLRSLFAPSAVAIVGASERNRYTSHAYGRLTQNGYAGPIHLVNPNTKVVFGQETVARLSELPSAPEFVFVAVPADAAVAALSEAAGMGVRAAVVVSGGFAESGDAGRERHRELVAVAARSAMSICGPTGLGVINVHGNFHAYGGGAFGYEVPRGHISVVSQSGGGASLSIEVAKLLGVGVSYVVSSGSEACVTAAEYISHFVDDSQTTVICAFLEEIRDPEGFAAAAARARTAGKPLIVVKVGRSAAAARMAQAHTGALTGPDDFYQALFRDLGVIRCDTIEQMIEQAAIFERSPRQWWPSGRRVGLVCRGGGRAGIAVELAAKLGLEIPPLGKDGAPGQILIRNPLEPRDDWSGAVERMATQDAIDTVVLVDSYAIDEVRVRHIAESRSRSGKPLIVAGPSPTVQCVTAEGQDLARELGIPILPSVDSALRALRGAVGYARTPGMPWPRSGGPEREIPEPVGTDVLDEHSARQLLWREVGVAGPAERLVRTANDAVAAAAELGYPVAIKLISPDITHRARLGLVALDVRYASEVGPAVERLLRRAGEQRREPRIEGILVQKMVDGVAELFLGVSCSVGFAPLVRVGVGGGLVEYMGSLVSRLAPIDRDTAMLMLRELPIAPLLQRVDADLEAAAETVVRVSEFAVGARRWASEIEINPLIVGTAATGALAVDALITRRGREGRPSPTTIGADDMLRER